MQLVADRFYVWYNRLATFVAVALVGLSLAATFVSSFEFLHRFGFRPIIAIIATIQVVYGLFLYRKRADNNIWMATLFTAMVLNLAFFALVHNSGQFYSAWMVSLYIQILLSGMFGPYSIVGTGFLMTIYYVLVVTGGPLGTVPVELFPIALLLASYMICFISSLIWKKFYISSDSQRISQLTGQLKGKQQQAEVLIQSISDGIVVTDTEGKISLLNPATAKMTGWPVEEAIGIDVKLVMKLQQEDGKELGVAGSPFLSVLQTIQQSTGTFRLLNRNDNTYAIVSLVVSPIIVGKGASTQGTVAVFRDVSEARAEENRRADFISTASHEMRTPVAAIEGYLALALNDKVSQIDAKARSYLVKAHESTQRLGKLFQDLLTSAKAEDGRLVNHPQVVEMGSYLEELTEGLRFAAQKKGLLMDFTIGSTGGPEAAAPATNKVVRPLYYTHIDPDRMREVITNLFDNAVKYTETGKISIALTGNDQVIQLFVRDTGPGIPPEDVGHLFQKFYRVDNSATRTIGGTGLGLFICRKIVELYQGRIWVESEVDKGSTFYINLPRLSSQKAAELQKTEQASASLQI